MLDRESILKALSTLSDLLQQQDIVGEINILGGTAMVLGFRARQATKDVDAIFAPAQAIRRAAAQVADQLNLPQSWLNDAAKGYLSPTGDFRRLAGLELPNLRIQVPTPQYMLAMKVMAARIGMAGERGDKEDIAFLIRLLGLRDTRNVMAIVERYYQPPQILPKSSYLVDEIMEEMAKDDDNGEP
ncbi:MAG: hypothetical protein FJW20_23940 [Acidimicrobiia bacterium]|nr:hypothetical protein [Acidimicrobiia bacterium]